MLFELPSPCPGSYHREGNEKPFWVQGSNAVLHFFRCGLKQQMYPMQKVSVREMEVLRLITGAELTNDEIAQKLNVSKRTIEFHRKNIMKKTGCKNLVQLVKYALKNGFIPP